MIKRILIASIITVVASALVVGCLLYNGVIWFNNPSQTQYPVRGVDVSSYQGAIDWNVLSQQGIAFAYMKATEGSSSHDDRFAYNWQHARQTQLMVGAYHFFSFASSGSTQAANYIHIVPKESQSLPPAVDIELYGDAKTDHPASDKTDVSLRELLDRLEAYYGKQPIIYATADSYDLYIKGRFPGYKIWIRNILQSPTLSDQRTWTFWQYSDRQVLNGYSGQERFIDMDVFNGTRTEFVSLAA